MAARAFLSQKPALQHTSRATASRAALASGHRSASASHSNGSDSGRERRRKGKQKMQQRILDLESQLADATVRISDLHPLKQRLDAALSRVSAFEERNAHLLAIIAHLTATADDPSGQASQRASAEFFDLYQDHVADAETQTDISVDITKPDIFLHVPQQGLPYATAHADAAAGLAQPGAVEAAQAEASLGLAEFDATRNRLRNFITDSQDSQQQDYKSQDLASSSGQFDVVTPSTQHCPLHVVHEPQQTQCGLLHRSETNSPSQNLACLDSSFLHSSFENCTGASQEADEPPNTKRRQALDDVNSEQRREFASGDSSSQNLAHSTRKSTGASHEAGDLVTARRQALEDLNSEQRHISDTDILAEPQRTQCGPLACSAKDFISQDTVSFSGSPTTGHFDVVTPCSEQCSTHAVDEPRLAQCGQLPQTGKDFASQVLVCLDTHLQTATAQRQAHDGHNSVHRCDSGSGSLSGPLEGTPSSAQCKTHAVSEPQHLQCGPLPPTAKDLTSQDLTCSEASCLALPLGNEATSKPRYHETPGTACNEATSKPRYLENEKYTRPLTREQHKTFDDYARRARPIIAAYRKRKNPSLTQIRAAATKILHIAKQYGVSKESCCQHLRESSLALTTAASDLWSS